MNLKALEILDRQLYDEVLWLDQHEEAIKELEEFSEKFETLQRYVKELECDCVSLQNDYSNKCKELEELNRSCVDCKYIEEFHKEYLDDIDFWYKCKNSKNPNVINLTNPKEFCCNRFEVKEI